MKYVIDTNIISEFMKPDSRQNVIWWAQDHSEDIYLNTVTMYELYYGLFLMPQGKRRTSRLEQLEAIVKDCSDRILAFDAFSSHLCAKMRSDQRANGRQITVEDCMIAAICARHNATLVTHNVKDFEHFAIDAFDPWDYESEMLERLKTRENEHPAP